MSFGPDPFAAHRSASGYLGQFGAEDIPVLVNYHEVRAAAADWGRFSNDAPGRVPIPAEDDIRDLRQLPIEQDPPAHTALKALLKEYFRRPQTDTAPFDPLPDGAVDVVRKIALPIQSRALAALLGLPEAEAEEWISWGLHAFRTNGVNDPARADRLLQMLERHTDRALAEGGEDFFGYLAAAQLDGRRLTRNEILGFAHVTFAGGRDTLILSMAAAVAHLAETPADLDRLRADPDLIPGAAEEIVRHLSPLSHIGRVCSGSDEVAGVTRVAGQRIALCWAAANADPAVFDEAQRVRIDRRPNPHVAYGSGPHSCLGSTHARQVLRDLLTTLTDRVDRIEPVCIVRAMRDIGGVPPSRL